MVDPLATIWDGFNHMGRLIKNGGVKYGIRDPV